MNQTISIKSAEFISSNSNVSKCPSSVFPEYAFIGRSNVGKSSLINMLCQKKKLAKVSNKPGKTKLINHFLINGNTNFAHNEKNAGQPWYLVDLPGYGYAGVSKVEKEAWKNWFADYFIKRENLMCAFILIDSRIPAQKIDMEFMRWLGEKKVPFSMVFTKSDKLSTNAVIKNISVYKREMMQWWEELPHLFITSSINNKGRDELIWFINETNKTWKHV